MKSAWLVPRYQKCRSLFSRRLFQQCIRAALHGHRIAAAIILYVKVATAWVGVVKLDDSTWHVPIKCDCCTQIFHCDAGGITAAQNRTPTCQSRSFLRLLTTTRQHVHIKNQES